MIDLSLFRFSIPLEIRFADIDSLGHVNNAKYITFMETARLAYFWELLGWSTEEREEGAIMARIDCDFKLPLVQRDAIRIYVRVSRIGSKSFDFEHVIVRESDQAEAARGTGVLVAYDYIRAQTIPIPAAWRDKMIAYEPGLK